MQPIYLRALELQDSGRTYKWHNDPALYDELSGVYRHVGRSSEEEWIKKKASYSNDQINLAICLSETDEHIGNISLTDIDWIARRAEVHMFIGDPANRSKGYGRMALHKMLQHAFDDLGLRRVFLTALSDNEKAIGLAGKCGFKVEGKLRNHAFKKGEFIDIMIMGICAGDPLPTII